MVDNRSAGFFGIGGSFNFKSGDISGTAAKTQDDKMGQGGEYFAQQRREDDDENQDSQKYTDRSAQLRATLNSLAMMNVANVINARKKAMEEQRERDRNSAEKNKRENAEKELEEEFYNIARELKDDNEKS
ncbi:unknown [Fusobacterium sp. CAG:439]|nr:unknown [Fusobacterium sp. CAG:439]